MIFETAEIEVSVICCVSTDRSLLSNANKNIRMVSTLESLALKFLVLEITR